MYVSIGQVKAVKHCILRIDARPRSCPLDLKCITLLSEKVVIRRRDMPSNLHIWEAFHSANLSSPGVRCGYVR